MPENEADNDQARPSSDLITELKKLRKRAGGDTGGYRSAVELDQPGVAERIAYLEAILKERGHL